ncbi:carboxylesterase/lipase family protein [Pseudonocardia sp. CA-142604]|uniref:carboxylesterase/lipase family protein n=1 Tax=Pseudonocardia sp. CA-142604 TaxID=3240024 RepID=UPI003D9173A9
MTDTEPTARTTAGVVRGRTEDGLQVFRGVPYARPPIGERRWLPAEPAVPWSGVRDASADGPVCPQPGRGPVPSLLGYTIDPAAMSEDCLTLTVWTPGADDRRRPVVVWIHGGGFLTGAGSLPLYSGSSPAEHGDVVVVAINYRVGPFGYLDCHPDDRSAGNRGLTDQALALQWITDNVASFGGDPGNVTAVGQSGGAWSILTLLGMPDAPPVRRAILQSPPLGSPMRTADDEARIRELYRSVLGVGDDAALRALPAGALVAAVPEMIGRTAEWGRYLPVFQPHVDGRYLHASVWDDVPTHSPHTEIMIGWTSREFAFFFGREPRPEDAPPARLVERMRWSFGDAADKALDRYRDLYRTDSVQELLTRYAGDEMFRIPCLDRAAALSAGGLPVHAYEFGLSLSGSTEEFGGAHCLEIPFVFGTFDAMRRGDAVLTRDVDAATSRTATDAMRSAWLAYARDGDPAVGATAGWAPFTADAPNGMVFCEQGVVAAPTGDLNAPLRAVWDDLRV